MFETDLLVIDNSGFMYYILGLAEKENVTFILCLISINDVLSTSRGAFSLFRFGVKK